MKDGGVAGEMLLNVGEEMGCCGFRVAGLEEGAGGRGEREGEEGCPHFTQLLLPAPVQLRRKDAHKWNAAPPGLEGPLPTVPRGRVN